MTGIFVKNLYKAVLVVSLLFLLCACSQKPLVWVPGWQKTSFLNVPRFGATVVVNNGFIYILGGNNGNEFLKTTEYAKIQQDGSLSPWRQGPLLNVARGYGEAVVHNGVVYIVGGSNGLNGENLLRSVESARILNDGSLISWVKEKHSLILPRRCSKVITKNNFIYAFGGYGGSMLDTIERTKILENGNIGKWILEPEKMLVPHYVNGVKEVGGVVYIVGGHDNTKGGGGGGIKNVEWSKIMNSGGLQAWQYTTPLQVGRYGLATVVHGNYVYALGGISKRGKFLDSIEKAKISSTGELFKWQLTSSLSMPKGTFSAIVYKDWIYILGGANNDYYISIVEFATFNNKGDIGFWKSKADPL